MTGARHLLDVDDLTPDDLAAVLAAADRRPEPVLAGRGVALFFEKPSARTRNATELAVAQLGGHAVSMRADDVGIDRRETAEDVARTLACYHAAICARVFDHGVLERMRSAVDIPVINLLSDRAHPCQAIADLLTLRKAFGRLAGLTVAYVGDWNNVSRSLGLALGLTGAVLAVACPPGFGPAESDMADLEAAGAHLRLHRRPVDAVRGAHAIYTDVWTSMGSEAQADARREAFAGWTVTAALMGAAQPGAVFLHCLPAHRGEEVEAAVVDGPASLVWAQAANRLPAARGVLTWTIGAA